MGGKGERVDFLFTGGFIAIEGYGIFGLPFCLCLLFVPQLFLRFGDVSDTAGMAQLCMVGNKRHVARSGAQLSGAGQHTVTEGIDSVCEIAGLGIIVVVIWRRGMNGDVRIRWRIELCREVGVYVRVCIAIWTAVHLGYMRCRHISYSV